MENPIHNLKMNSFWCFIVSFFSGFDNILYKNFVFEEDLLNVFFLLFYLKLMFFVQFEHN